MALLIVRFAPRVSFGTLRVFRIGLLLLALFGGCTSVVRAQPAPSAENQIKAVFLFNFAQFVEWPAAAFHDSHAPLVIGILGDDPFGPYLDDLVKGERIGDHPMGIRRFRRSEDVTDCQILFISRAERGPLDKLLARFEGRHLLTVGDADDFNRAGGIIRLLTENGKIRFKIDVAAAKSSGLKISSKLLGPATVVNAVK